MWLYPKGYKLTLFTNDNGKVGKKNTKDHVECHNRSKCHLILQKTHGKLKTLNRKDRVRQAVFGRSTPFLYNSTLKKQVYPSAKSPR